MASDFLRTIHLADAVPTRVGPTGSQPGIAGPLGNDAGSNPAASTTTQHFAVVGPLREQNTPTLEQFDRALLWRYRAQLLKVLDGDTARVLADCGFGGRHEVAVRLAGYSAPERHQPGGAEATLRLLDALSRGVGEWPLRIATLQRDTVVAEVRSFERYVGLVWVVTPERLIPVVELLR